MENNDSIATAIAALLESRQQQISELTAEVAELEAELDESRKLLAEMRLRYEPEYWIDEQDEGWLGDNE